MQTFRILLWTGDLAITLFYFGLKIRLKKFLIYLNMIKDKLNFRSTFLYFQYIYEFEIFSQKKLKFVK